MSDLKISKSATKHNISPFRPPSFLEKHSTLFVSGAITAVAMAALFLLRQTTPLFNQATSYFGNQLETQIAIPEGKLNVELKNSKISQPKKAIETIEQNNVDEISSIIEKIDLEKEKFGQIYETFTGLENRLKKLKKTKDAKEKFINKLCDKYKKLNSINNGLYEIFSSIKTTGSINEENLDQLKKEFTDLNKRSFAGEDSYSDSENMEGVRDPREKISSMAVAIPTKISLKNEESLKNKIYFIKNKHYVQMIGAFGLIEKIQKEQNKYLKELKPQSDLLTKIEKDIEQLNDGIRENSAQISVRFHSIERWIAEIENKKEELNRSFLSKFFNSP